MAAPRRGREMNISLPMQKPSCIFMQPAPAPSPNLWPTKMHRLLHYLKFYTAQCSHSPSPRRPPPPTPPPRVCISCAGRQDLHIGTTDSVHMYATMRARPAKPLHVPPIYPVSECPNLACLTFEVLHIHTHVSI